MISAVATTQRSTSATWRRIATILLAAAALAVSARIMLPVPSSPVPVSAQTLAVVLIGALLGAEMGLVSVATYILAGLAGLPIFTAGGGAAYLLSPTAGYLLGFLPAAWIAGKLCGRSSGPWARLGGLLLAVGAIYALGLAWLSMILPAGKLLMAGLVVFLPGEAVKVMIAALTIAKIKR